MPFEIISESFERPGDITNQTDFVMCLSSFLGWVGPFGKLSASQKSAHGAILDDFGSTGGKVISMLAPTQVLRF